MKYSDVTKIIIGCAFDVANELGSGFLESIYENALSIALKEKGFNIDLQYPINVSFRGKCVGKFYADIFVDKKVIIELKAVKKIIPEHQAQIINYLKATGVEVGLLINFGNPKLEYLRFTRNKK